MFDLVGSSLAGLESIGDVYVDPDREMKQVPVTDQIKESGELVTRLTFRSSYRGADQLTSIYTNYRSMALHIEAGITADSDRELKEVQQTAFAELSDYEKGLVGRYIGRSATGSELYGPSDAPTTATVPYVEADVVPQALDGAIAA